MLLARITRLDVGDRRTDARLGLDSPSTARGADNAAVDVTVIDLSASGLAFTSDEVLDVESRISIGLAGAGRVSATVVRREGLVHGCEFDRSLTTEQLAHAFSASGTPDGQQIFLHRHEPVDDKWSLRTRVAVAIGLGGLVWAVILAIVFYG